MKGKEQNGKGIGGVLGITILRRLSIPLGRIQIKQLAPQVPL